MDLFHRLHAGELAQGQADQEPPWISKPRNLLANQRNSTQTRLDLSCLSGHEGGEERLFSRKNQVIHDEGQSVAAAILAHSKPGER